VTDGIDLDWQTAARAFGDAYFNLIRRGADGSLTLSMDHWHLDVATDNSWRFVAREPEATPLDISLDEIGRIVWDRLPKQQVRSQLRLLFVNGDVWTFSGSVDESVLPSS
jgi:hypothetical protein